jgi:hypothetical protein
MNPNVEYAALRSRVRMVAHDGNASSVLVILVYVDAHFCSSVIDIQ